MLVEVTLGIGQVFLRHGGKHTVRGYPVCERPKRASHTNSALATAGDSKGTGAVIVRPLGTNFRRKQNDFAETGRWFAVMPDRMAETEPAKVYVIHFLRCFPDRANLTGTFLLRFMPKSLAAIHTRFVHSLHKMTAKNRAGKQLMRSSKVGTWQCPQRFDCPALLVPRKPARQIAASET